MATNWETTRAECIATTGFLFEPNTVPTVAQLRNMCGNEACMDHANLEVRSLVHNRGGLPLDYTYLHTMIYPIIDFCYFHRVPSDPCPVDFVAQLLIDMKPLVDACETKSGFSFAKRPPAISYDGDNRKLLSRLCGVTECDNLMKRLHVKYFVESCQPYARWDPVLGTIPAPADYEALWYTMVQPYRLECDGYDSPVWYLPVYGFWGVRYTIVRLPGPLPGDPRPVNTTPPANATSPPFETGAPVNTSATATPTPTPTPTPVASTAEPSMAPKVATPPRPVAVVNAPTSSASPRMERNSSSPDVPERERGSETGHRGDLRSSVQDVASTIVLPTSVPSSAPTTTDTPTLDAVNQSSNADTTDLQWSIGVSLAVAVLVVFFFVVRHYRRRHLHRAKTTDGYKSFDGSSTDTNASEDAQDTVLLHGALLLPCREIPFHELIDVRVIGGGGFGIVYLVRHTSDHNRLLASKRISKENHTKHQLESFVAEIQLSASLSHPRIVSLVGVAGLHKNDLQALFEYLPGGDLKYFLDSQPPLSLDPVHHSWTPVKLQIAIDVADALVYLHTLEPTPVVHRDLKSRNIMLTSDTRAKLGDFGISRTESTAGSMTTGVGTSRWVAPEVILGGGDYTTACDVYSFGVVLTELDTHRLPFAELTHANGEQLADFVVLEMVATQRQQPSLSTSCPLSLVALTQRCLAFEPEHRPRAADVAEALRAVQRERGGFEKERSDDERPVSWDGKEHAQPQHQLSEPDPTSCSIRT